MPHKYTLGDAAKMLGTGRNRLTAQLKQRGILDHKCLPKKQADIDAGRFAVDLKQHHGNPNWNEGKGQLYHQTLVTQKGLSWLATLLNVNVTDADQQKEHAA
jgi:phage antirepressor YoqD-like protein